MAVAPLCVERSPGPHVVLVLDNRRSLKHKPYPITAGKCQAIHVLSDDQLAIVGFSGYPYSARSRAQILSSIALTLRP
jgi:hypothetical protein